MSLATHDEAPRGSRTASATAQVTAFLHRYSTAWSSRNLQGVVDLWAPSPHEVSYIAEELSEVLLTREQVSEHLLRTENRLTTCSVDVSDIMVHPLSHEVVLTTFLCRWDLEWVSHSRITAVLRKIDDEWLFLHYAEAPFHTLT